MSAPAWTDGYQWETGYVALFIGMKRPVHGLLYLSRDDKPHHAWALRHDYASVHVDLVQHLTAQAARDACVLYVATLVLNGTLLEP